MAVILLRLLIVILLLINAYPWLLQPRSTSPPPTPQLTPPDPNDPRFTQWSPPGPDDVRSPCPGLNTCANHGFINHSGRDNTIANLLPGLAACLNMGADFTIGIATAALPSSPNPLAGAFDLDDIDEHNFPIEHDASLSRQDAYFGNDYSFYQPNFDQVLSFYAESEYTNITQAAKARHARFADSLSKNPQFVYGLREFIFSYGETALYLQSMSDIASGVARVDFIRSLFEQEKLPYDLGWRPSALPITLTSLGNMVLELFAANPEAVPEGVRITVDTVKDVFEGIDPLTGLVANATSNL